MREVFDVLERLGFDHFLTGSEAGSLYGCVRQSFDTDIVVDLDAARFDLVEHEFAAGYAVSPPLDFGDFSMASIISTQTAEKVDLIMRRPSPWAVESMRRRRRLEHPDFGRNLGLLAGGPRPCQAHLVGRNVRTPAARLRDAPPRQRTGDRLALSRALGARARPRPAAGSGSSCALTRVARSRNACFRQCQ